MISIIIPTFNHQKLLPYCLDSIRRQTYKDYEIIVVDDGSDYDVKKLLKNYPEVIFYQQEHLGAPAARNKGFSLSLGESIIFTDDDVVMKPNMLFLMHQKLLSNPDVSYVYSSYKLGWKMISSLSFAAEKLKKINYIHTTSLMRRDDFPGWDETLKKFQDWDLWLTLLAKGKKGINIAEVCYQIIKPSSGHMSTWLPKFFYDLPWPILSYTPRAIQNYREAKSIIYHKHNL